MEVNIDFLFDFDAKLALFWRHFGRPGRVWRHLGPSWRHLGAILGRLGAILGRLGPSWELLELDFNIDLEKVPKTL